MIDFDNYLCYGSENVDKLKVNARINMNCPKQKLYFGLPQRVIEVIDALVCKYCGHIEFVLIETTGKYIE